MAKVAIKKREDHFLSVEFITLWTFFSKLGFEKLTESVLGKRGSSGKAFCYGSIFLWFFILPHWFGVGDFMLRKEPRNTEAPHINI